jgi:transposase
LRDCKAIGFCRLGSMLCRADIPPYRFEKMLSRHGVDIPRKTLARWMIQSGQRYKRCST